MATLREYRDRWHGKTVTIVGGAVTTVDYRTLPQRDQPTVLVNWALRIAPMWRGTGRPVHFFSWHMAVFSQFTELLTPELVPCLWEGDLLHLQPEIRGKAVKYTAMNIRPWEAYTHLLLGYREHGRDWIDEGGFIPSHANTMLLALMFVWYSGCRQIDAVGMHDIGGVSAGGYDPRLKALTPYWNSPAYTRDVAAFCEMMGIQVNYLGDR